MDTQKTIDDLQILSDALRKEGNDKIGIANGIDISISQLKGILATQAIALKQQYEEVIITKDTEIASLQDALEDAGVSDEDNP